MMDRRKFLRVAGLSAVAAPVAAPAMVAGVGGGSALGLACASDLAIPTPAHTSSRMVKLTNFSDWLKHGAEHLKRRARSVNGFDADILDRRLPMATKVRLQQERNFQRLLADEEQDFMSRLQRYGFVERWT